MKARFVIISCLLTCCLLVSILLLSHNIAIAQEAPVLLSPTNGATDVPVEGVSFSWSQSLVADTVSPVYEVELATDEDFSLILASGTVTVNAWVTDITLDYSTTYYWRVRVTVPMLSDWSIGSFTTEKAPAPPVIVIIEPLDGEQGQTIELAISGKDFVDGATVLFSPPTGITVTPVIFVGDNEIRVTIAIAEDAPLGPRDVTIYNPDGQNYTLEDGFTVTEAACVGDWDVSVLGRVKSTYEPGETISGSLEFRLNNPSDCPGCIQQILVGLADAHGNRVSVGPCIYDAIPAVCPDWTTGTGSFSLTAPSVPGTYRLIAANDYQYNCPDAQNRFPAQDSQKKRELAVIAVGEAPGPTAALIADSRTVVPGGTVKVPVNLNEAENIGSMNFVLTYDPEVLEVIGVDAGAHLSGIMFVPNYEELGVIYFGFATADGLNGSGSVAYIEFQAVGSEGSSSPLILSEVVAKDTSGQTVWLSTPNRMVTIGEKTLLGDYNGDGKLTEVDALAALRASVGALEEDLILDMDMDGKVTAEDARLIMKHAVAYLEEPEPDIAVSPETLDFERVTLGEGCSREFGIQNVGDADLTVASITLEKGIEFELEQAGGFTLAPGEARTIPVTFTPAGCITFTDNVTIHSNDPDEPTVTVSLSGEGELVTAKIIAVSGDVWVKLPGADEFEEPSVSMELPEGSTLETGFDSTVIIEFGPGIVVEISALSIVDLEKLCGETQEGMTLRIGSGKARVSIKKSAIKTDFEVLTPNVTTSVKGTTFSVQHSIETDTSVLVIFEGSIDVSRIRDYPIEVWEAMDVDEMEILETVTIRGDGQGNGQRVTAAGADPLVIEDLHDMDPADW